MDKPVVVVSREPELVGDVEAEQLFRPRVVRHVGVEVACAKNVQRHERHEKRVAQAADLQPVLHKRQAGDDGHGGHVLQPEVFWIRHVDAARSPEREEYRQHGSIPEIDGQHLN